MRKRQGGALDWDGIVEEMKRGDVTIDVLARRYNISRSAIQSRFIEATGTPYRCYLRRLQEAKIANIREYANAHPTVAYSVIAKLFKTSMTTVSKALKGFSKNAAAYKEIQALVKSNPLKSYAWFVEQTRRGYTQIKSAVNALSSDGWYLDLEREILVDEFFETHPGATARDAAEYFDAEVAMIYAVRSSAARGARYYETDKLWGASCITPPEKTQNEIETRGGFGVKLPPPEMARFIALHDQKIKDNDDEV